MPPWPNLNLPKCELRVKRQDDVDWVWDIIRKKFIILTPEEWVRQHFLHLMIDHLNYPGSWIKVESGLKYFKSTKRTDILLLKRDGSPFLLVECKSADSKLNQTTLKQIATYNKSLQAPYIAITNGLKHFIWKLDFRNASYQSHTQFPAYPDS
ncbi:MAG: type I restriction enzyme HsdR N-terminal domain-containing protein [Cyclobacteriaceae bacterium]|nr:type I restriction enzyme HsdR N-terminal domain-containing protein [Cyclobacteriaceae bacterium HetDA_MAG_MS6]